MRIGMATCRARDRLGTGTVAIIGVILRSSIALPASESRIVRDE